MKSLLIDLTGQVFGRWTVLKRSGTSKHKGEACWLCKCKCGTEKFQRSDYLRGGKTKSCGCLRPLPKPKTPKPSKAKQIDKLRQLAIARTIGRDDLTGRVFGELTVIAPTILGYRCVEWLCKCSCGEENSVPAYRLKSGHTKSCGCLSPFRTKHEMHLSSEYRCWTAMLCRCRNPKNNAWRIMAGVALK